MNQRLSVFVNSIVRNGINAFL